MLTRRVSLGAELVSGGTHFRVFADKPKRIDVVIEGSGRTVALTRDANGYFEGLGDGVAAGARYKLRLDGGEKTYPDPASRFQPDGPHGASEVVDPKSYAWTDSGWKGCAIKGQVVYEMHIGTFTKEGTYAAAAEQLEELKRAGITLLEIMPLAEFSGKFGWGYDGVDLYAPTRLYGRPDDLRAFVDRAHAVGLGVILDVVYNHFGPDGNYVRELSEHYFTDKYDNEWGDALDFETSPGARELFAANGAYWIDEFHFDGLRLDATQSIHDDSKEHLVAEVVRRARAASKGREIVVFVENERQQSYYVRSRDKGGYDVDSMWNDDFHHSARVAATGHAEAYYSPTKGTAQELISAVKWGYLFQGQHYTWQDMPRGHAGLDLSGPALTLFLQNHDQVANTPNGKRFHQLTSAGIHRAMTTLYLLAPGTPLIFMGEEFAASTPFLYFADHTPELAKAVAAGRKEFVKQFPSATDPAMLAQMLAPHDVKAFESCKLDFSEREKHKPTYDLFKDLLKLRREDSAFSAQDKSALHGAVLADGAFCLRFATGTGDDRLVVVSLHRQIDVGCIGEPLLAPVDGTSWDYIFSTDDPKYGGLGYPPLVNDGALPVFGQSAVVFAPGKKREEIKKEKTK